jgi:glycosyltransferase involved in cell wall biosynthesis
MLFVLNSLSVGGSERKIVRVANALAQSGVGVTVAYLNPPETLLDKIDPDVTLVNLGRRGKYSLRALRTLKGLVDREPHAVVAVNLYPLLYVIPASGWPVSRSLRVFGLVNTSEPIGRKWRLKGLYIPLLKRCTQVIFGAKSQQELWVRKYGLTMGQSRVIYNGVDHEFYSPDSAVSEGEKLRQSLGIPSNSIVIGTVCRLAPEKNLEAVVFSLSRLVAVGRETYAVFVGQGEEQERLEGLAKSEGVSGRLKFLGMLSDIRPAISMIDIFVLPSRAVETFSNAALEAMAMARAVVLSDIGGAAEMVEDGVSGMLFQVGDTSALIGILNRLHDSPEMRQALGIAARERVVRQFSFKGMLQDYRLMLSGAP